MRHAIGRNANSAGFAVKSAGFAMMAALALGGCISTTPTVSPTAAQGATVTFESVDGPPRPVATRMARSLDHEATARRLVVVPRGGQAIYYVRGYLAAHAEGGATTLVWAFDVYDAERRRAFRVRGEERAPGAGAWAAADDPMLQRIASAGVAQLMTFIASDRSGATAEAPRASTLAGIVDHSRPESAGFVRQFVANPTRYNWGSESQVSPTRAPFSPPRAGPHLAFAAEN